MKVFHRKIIVSVLKITSNNPQILYFNLIDIFRDNINFL
jgi:hypothetical protein